MGNVPISCCRSKSPRAHHSKGNHKSAVNQHYSDNRGDSSRAGGGGEDQESRHSPSHILQHISEREPDDSDTDPSSNPLNRPIFASRSSSSAGTKNNISNKQNSQYTDSYSSTTSRQQNNNTPLTSSQDQGYNSNTSTNLTQNESVNLNNSFETSIQQHRDSIHQIQSNNAPPYIPLDTRTTQNNSLMSPIYSQDTNLPQVEASVKQIRDEFHIVNLLKSSSCSTIFTDGSTISQPDLNQTIKCVSLAVYYHIKNRTSDSFVEVFDESVHPLKMPSLAANNNERQDDDQLIVLEQQRQDRNDCSSRIEEPDHAAIYWFIKTLFKAAQLTSEYAITTLVYLERLMTYAEMDLTPKTWRRMFLGALLLSSKVWEDQAVWNVDYAQILEEISVEDINELERQFLELIQFNMNVPSSVYAKYYFHLRTLALKHGFSREHALLTVGEAKTLEAMSQIHIGDWNHSPIQRKSTPAMKRHTSLEKLRQNGFAKAVLM